MRICTNCQNLIEFDFSDCGFCQNSIDVVNGFYAFSPNQAQDGNGFKIESFSHLANLEEGNFWFNSRNKLIIYLIKSFHISCQKFLEIGCGTGYILKAIHTQFPKINLFGSELFTQGLEFAAQRLPDATFMQMDARTIPFENEFDCIGLFDVLEHIDKDKLVLLNIHKALKNQGFLFITVPQHEWLWSPIDDMACHVRRYEIKDLSQKLEEVGFKMVFSSSFLFFLLPAMFISRQIQSNKKNASTNSEFEIPRFLNFIFGKILNFEVFLIQKGFRFPIGGSRVVVAQKI